MEFNPELIFHTLEEAAEKKAEAAYQARILERDGEILMGHIMVRIKQDTGTPVSMLKEVARTTAEWKTHIRGEAVAIKEKEVLAARYNHYVTLAEHRRTEEATRRYLTK